MHGGVVGDIWLIDAAGKTLTPLVQTPSQDTFPAFSPDGRWLAYVSNETGRDEVYIRPHPGPGPPEMVSVGGGAAPV